MPHPGDLLNKEQKKRQRGASLRLCARSGLQGPREYGAKLETFQSAKCVRLMLPRHLLAGLFVRVSNMAAVGSKGIVQGPLLRRTLAQPRLARAFVACSGERPAASPFASRLMHTSQQLAAARGRPVTTGAAAVSALPLSKCSGQPQAVACLWCCRKDVRAAGQECALQQPGLLGQALSASVCHLCLRLLKAGSVHAAVLQTHATRRTCWPRTRLVGACCSCKVLLSSLFMTRDALSSERDMSGSACLPSLYVLVKGLSLKFTTTWQARLYPYMALTSRARVA